MPKSCPEEHPLTLFVNGYELATYQITKSHLDDWAIGHLFTEGIINTLADINTLTIKPDQVIIHAVVNGTFDEEDILGKKRFVTAGCGRGTTFFSMTDVQKLKKVTSTQQVTLSYLLKKRHEFARNSPLYLQTGGMHGACLLDPVGNLTVREDIGRHNAVDKAIGYALRKGLKPEDLILLTTGRISYEMLLKAARFGIGIVGSRTAATRQAVQLANYLHVEVVGYLRGKMANVYTHMGRVTNDLRQTMDINPEQGVKCDDRIDPQAVSETFRSGSSYTGCYGTGF